MQKFKYSETSVSNIRSVSLSSDGNTLAVGEINQPISTTKIWINVNDVWNIQKNLIQPNIGTGFNYYGRSVSLSADGNTLAVGSPGDGDTIGYVYIYNRFGSNWSNPIQLSYNNRISFGYCVSLSADGKILAVGSPLLTSDGIGMTLIYRDWINTPTEELQYNDYSSQGFSVSLSADGN